MSFAKGWDSAFDDAEDADEAKERRERQEKLRDATVSGPRFRDMEIPPRPNLLGQWLREGDLGYIFAPRGHGKSWLAMLIANAVAEGTCLGDWPAGEPRRVLYFDAEMNLPDVQERAKLLGIESEMFIWL